MATLTQTKKASEEIESTDSVEHGKKRGSTQLGAMLGKADMGKVREKQVQSNKQKIGTLCDLLVLKCPKLEKFMGFLKPFILILYSIQIIVAPFIVLAYHAIYGVYKVTQGNLVKALYGLSICFFGGEFVVTLAAVEAFQQGGGYKMKEFCDKVIIEMNKYRMEAKKDELVHGFSCDQSEDCHADNINRQISIFFKSTNPDILNEGLAGIYQGFLAIYCVLKLQFARTIALALSVAEYLETPFVWILDPICKYVFPDVKDNWVQYFAKYSCKIVALTFAWWLEVIINTFQSGIKGGVMFSRNMFKYLNARKITNFEVDKDSEVDDIKGWYDEALGWSIAACGIWWQISHFWDLPFPFNIFLLPLEVFEWVLRWIVTWN